ncbi:MAG: LamG-like jellyroll fold domain-containing protein, partial [Candidatus Micrarchaeales archaeon]
VQIYSTALTPQQIQQLYLQGINSPPIPNAGLVGWWPLQGNANDYSPYNNFGTPYNIIYNSTYPNPITGQTIVGNKIIFGSGKGVYAYYFNGTSAWNFSTGANTVTGPIAYYGNKVFFQTTGGIYALYASNGSLAWYSSPSLTASSMDYPVIGGGKVYAIWGDNKIYVYNVSNGNSITSITIPIVGSGHTQLALANGNLYVGAGNNIYAFGNCKGNKDDTVLNAIARFYANKQYFCANQLAFYAFSNSSRQMNYGIWINGSYLPSISAQFNGVNAYIIVPNSPSISSTTSSLTISLWAYLKYKNDWDYLLEDGQYTPTQSRSYGIVSNPPNNYLHVFLEGSQISPGYAGTSLYGLSNYYNKWTHILMVWDGSTLKLYVNGQFKNSTTVTGTLTPNWPLNIGRTGKYNDQTFNGSIANVQIYSTALTPQQIQQLYLQGINSPPIPNAGLVGWWPLQGNANDYSPYNNFGTPYNIIYNSTYPNPITGQTIVGNKIIFGSGKGVYAYYFNGTSAWNFSTGANTVTGPIAYYGNKVFFQTTGGIYALYASNGSLAWYSSPSLTASSMDYPVIGGGKVYAIWGDNKIYVYNVSNGNSITSITIPIVGSGHTQLALANGNLYVGAGNNIYAFGNCKGNKDDTVLNAIARFYANKQYFCANQLAFYAFSNSSRQMNYGIWINGSYLPSISAQFNGVNAYIIVPNSPSISSTTSSLTISLWAYLKYKNDWDYLLEDGQYTPTQSRSYGIVSNPPNNYLHVFLEGSQISPGYAGTSLYGLSNYYNKWTHILMVWDGSTLKLYVNGQFKNSTTVTGTLTPNWPLNIGRTGKYNDQTFNGSIANVQIYSTALTPQQIQQLYLQGINSPPIPNAGLVGWWPLNGDTNDYSGWFNTGFPFNGVIFNSTKYPIPFTSASSSSAFGAGFNSFGSTNSSRTFDITIVEWSRT